MSPEKGFWQLLQLKKD